MRILTHALLSLLLTAIAFAAEVPTWTTLNLGLDDTFGTLGKGVLDPQVAGFSGIAYGNGTWVALGNSVGQNEFHWLTSADASTWTPHSQALPSGSTTGGSSKVHFLNGHFVFFATHSDGGFANTYVFTSSDGLTWTQTKVRNGAVGVAEFDGSPTLTVAAGGNGAQIYSSDLTTWNSGPVVTNGGSYSHDDLAYGSGHFVSTINGFGGQSYTSTDGATWTPISGFATPGGFYLEYGNGVFLAGSGDEMWKSTDGATFTKYTTNHPFLRFPNSGSMRFAGGRFLCQAGDFTSGRPGYIASTDGVTWTDFGTFDNAPPPPAGQISRGYTYVDLAFGNGKYVLVGLDVYQAAFSKTTLPLMIVAGADAATYTPPPSPPAITTQPASVAVVAGHAATFTVAVQGSGTVTYQWKHDGSVVAGATGVSFTIAQVSESDLGAYVVEITNTAGTTTSAAASLTVVSASDAGHLVNVSIRGDCGAGENALLVGAVIAGSGTKPLLVRAIGPTLARFGVSAPLADPALRLVAQGSGSALANNDDWSGDGDVTRMAPVVGAFAIDAASKDAALFAPAVAAGAYSVVVSQKNTDHGPTLAEIYDAEELGAFSANSPRLVNISGRGHVGSGENLLIAGFVIAGSTPVRVLVRGVGPTLANQGVSAVLADPQLALYRSGTVAALATNDNWESSNAAEIAAAASSAGAFALPAGSKDAALLVTLPPGIYTTHLTGVGGTTGVGLIEVYEAP